MKRFTFPDYCFFSVVLFFLTLGPYYSSAKSVKFKTNGEIFPDIIVTYKCRRVNNPNGYAYTKNDDGTIDVNMGFFRWHRTLKVFDCQ